ncbi:MAG: metallophosphatase [Sphingobacteriales bacterium]|nr:MAG: metallophosphatase [Sphingobacteriales bacterium]
MKDLHKCHLLLLLLIFLSSCAPKAFKLVLLPDTQTYCSDFPEIFYAQTEWIADNKDSISFVLHQGDITNNNSDKHWTVASAALNRLDGKVPYTFVPGNHDIGTGGKSDIRNTDKMNAFLPLDKFNKTKSFGGAFENGKMDNTWHQFKAGGLKWLILSLEFGPRNSVVDWAKQVIEGHPNHKIIINTHAYMYSDNQRISKQHNHKWVPQDYGLGKENGANAVNDGEQLWEKLASKYSNVLFVFSGHVLNDGTGTLVSTGDKGNQVYQMLANYQGGVINTIKGGNGNLRILYIDPKKGKISVKTYSPYTKEYKREQDQEFNFTDVRF